MIAIRCKEGEVGVLLVTCPADMSAKSTQLFGDGVCSNGPHEWLAIRVVCDDEVVDAPHESLDAGEQTAAFRQPRMADRDASAGLRQLPPVEGVLSGRHRGIDRTAQPVPVKALSIWPSTCSAALVAVRRGDVQRPTSSACDLLLERDLNREDGNLNWRIQ